MNIKFFLQSSYKKENFIELGSGFTFVRQHYKPEYSGQVNFYCSAVDGKIAHKDDNLTIEIIEEELENSFEDKK